MAKYKKIDPKGVLNALIYKSDNGGCGYIRTVLPSDYISSWRFGQMTFNFNHSSLFINDMNYYKQLSFIKFQRSATHNQLQMIKHIKNNIKQHSLNIGVLYESDDDLFNIPNTNYAYDFYEKNRKNIEKILSMVDGITVSTLHLKKLYSKYNKNINIVKNRLMRHLWGNVKFRNFENVSKRVKILYPGSQNHFSTKKDIIGGDIGKVLMNYIKKTTKEIEWIFVGGKPLELEDEIKSGKITYHSWLNIMNYPLFMKNVEFDIGIAPLENNEFNKSKSNLKMLEYTICGVPAIYSKIEPYNFAKMTASDDNEFIFKLETLIDNVDLREKVWKADYHLLKNELFFEDHVLEWLNGHMNLFGKKL